MSDSRNAYVQLVRPQWFLTSTLAAMVGIFQAATDGYYDLPLAILVIVGLMLHHAILETWDELQDFARFRRAQGDAAAQPPTLFSGGSGVLTGMLLSEYEVWLFLTVLVLCGLAVLGAIVFMTGWAILVCVAAGAFVMLNYAWGLKLAYRGFGEIANCIGFGPILICSSYVAMRMSGAGVHRAPSGLGVVTSIPGVVIGESAIVGMLWLGSEHIQGMLDSDEDRAGGKRTLVVKLGRRYASLVPMATATVMLLLTARLIAFDRGFVVVLPAVLLHLVETARFAQKWADDEYFVAKTTNFFVYRNFALLGVSLILSFAFRASLHPVGFTSVLALGMLTVASSMPAIYFLARNNVFIGAGVGR